jgi:gamma-glutamyl-gamma-aminobutyrate hydrolase PuuD
MSVTSGHVAPLIGLSPRLLRHVPPELGFRGKTLQYLEQSLATMIAAGDAVPVMIPSVIRDAPAVDHGAVCRGFATHLDGLVLQGGADIHPSCYGQQPRYPDAITDVVRDRFELELLRAFIAEGKPVLGVCRGMQLINVLFGGTLHQDLLDEGASRDPHVVPEAGEEYRHGLVLQTNGWLSALYGGIEEAQVNSIHHQGIDRLGEGLQIEALSHDGVIEAVRHEDAEFVVGVQWHPEFHDVHYPELMPPGPLVRAFLAKAATHSGD